MTTSTTTPASAQAVAADVIVIGSGYAGSVAALRLAEAGHDVVLLERGRRWPITPQGNTFATQENIDGRAAWLSTSSPFGGAVLTPFTGVLEIFPGDGVACMAGAGVGGGSLVNNAVMMQPRQDLFEATMPATLDYTEFDTRWYPAARALIGVEPIPDDVLAAAPYANARQFLVEAQQVGMDAQRPPMAVDWEIVRREMAGTAVASAILGQSIFGINSGAKRSVDRSILAAAEATGRVSVRPLHIVQDIVDAGSSYRVPVERIDENGKVVERLDFTAKTVFVAAGSIATSRLLVRARGRGSLPHLNDHVGRHWGTGGDHIVIRAGLPLPAPEQGGPAHVVGTVWDDPQRAAVTLLNFPLGVPLLGDLAREMLAVSRPPAVGRFRYESNSDSVQLTWPTSNSGVRAITAAVRAAAGKLRQLNPFTAIQVVTPLLTSHSLGGAVLGKATGDDGELHGHPGLFVIDSALIPGATGSVPPALTVTALADRCVTKALERGLPTASPAAPS